MTKPDLPKVTDVAEHTDTIGNTYRIEVTTVDGLGAPSSGELVGKLWELVTGIVAQSGYGIDAMTALCEHEIHGARFEDYFARED